MILVTHRFSDVCAFLNVLSRVLRDNVSVKIRRSRVWRITSKIHVPEEAAVIKEDFFVLCWYCDFTE